MHARLFLRPSAVLWTLLVGVLVLLPSMLGVAPAAHAGALDCRNSGYFCTPGYTGSIVDKATTRLVASGLPK